MNRYTICIYHVTELSQVVQLYPNLHRGPKATPRRWEIHTYLIIPSLVPITFTRSESQLSLRGVGENSPYMIDGLAIKSVQKQTVNGLMSESWDFLSKSLARDNIVSSGLAPPTGRRVFVGGGSRTLPQSLHRCGCGDMCGSTTSPTIERLCFGRSGFCLSTALPLKQDVYVRMLRRLVVLNDGGDCWLPPLRPRLLQRGPGRNA